MEGPRFAKTPLPVQGRSIGIAGKVTGQHGDNIGPLTVSLDNLTFISAVNLESPASSPSKPSKGPGYFKKRKREFEESQIADDSGSLQSQ
jgi:hypothetical protein